MSTRRGTTLVEAILAIVLAAALTIACATLYGFVSSRLMVDGTHAAVLSQANRLADDLTKVISQSRLCDTVTSGSVTALRCHLPATGLDSNLDGLIDKPTPYTSEPDGFETFSTGNYVWFYMSDATGAFGTTGAYMWRAKPTTTANPAAANYDGAWALYYGGGSRWNFIDSVTFSNDPGEQTTTFTIQASSLNRAERSGSAAGSAEVSKVTITRTVHWRFARNLVENASFETPNGGTTPTTVQIKDDGLANGWITTGDYVDIHVAGSAATPFSGNQILDCASNVRSGVRQTLMTSPSRSYVLSFYYTPRSGVTDNTVEVWWNGSKIDTLTGTTPGWVEKNYTVTATSYSTQLEFRDASVSDSYTGLIDQVSVLEF